MELFFGESDEELEESELLEEDDSLFDDDDPSEEEPSEADFDRSVDEAFVSLRA